MEETTIEEIQAAFEQLRTWGEAVWQAIVDALKPLADLLSRMWRDLCDLFLVPCQHRDTMAGRKIRRSMLLLAAAGSATIRRRGSSAPMICDRYLGEFPHTRYGWRIAEQRAREG